ncbi:MAG: acyl-CoA thioesterase [Chitinophagaceae bacterium]
MSRIKIVLPDTFPFTTRFPVRITDLNYGGHAGNDAILAMIHEIRMQFLAAFGLTELDFGGAGLIMSDVGIEFRAELYYGETVIASAAIANLGKVAFDIYYKLEKETENGPLLVASARTGMVCFDYSVKKIVSIPENAKKLLGA